MAVKTAYDGYLCCRAAGCGKESFNLNSPKVSLIIPIYNSGKYLRECLESAVRQTLRELEIICVDDCSTDGSPDIIREFASQDDRITVITMPKNMGAGLSRKAGVETARGEYIMFLDGDDFLTDDACQEAYDAIYNDNSDFLRFGMELYPVEGFAEKDTVRFKNYLRPYKEPILCTRPGEMALCCFVWPRTTHNVCDKIFRMGIVKQAIAYYQNERFDFSEDLYLFFLICCFSLSSTVLDKQLYCYHYGAGITGKNAALATDRFLKAAGSMNIYRLLCKFADERKELTDISDALAAIKNRLENSAVAAAARGGWQLKPDAFEQAAPFPDADSFMGRILARYHAGKNTEKRQILETLASQTYLKVPPKPVKVIAVLPGTVSTGQEAGISELVSLWTDNGYQVIMLAEEGEEGEDRLLPGGTHRCLLPRLTDFRADTVTRRIRALKEIVEREHIDLFVAQEPDDVCTLADIVAARLAGVLTVIYCHDSFISQSLRPTYALLNNALLRPPVFNLCDAVITVSAEERNWWNLHHRRVYEADDISVFHDLKTGQYPEQNVKVEMASRCLAMLNDGLLINLEGLEEQAKEYEKYSILHINIRNNGTGECNVVERMISPYPGFLRRKNRPPYGITLESAAGKMVLEVLCQGSGVLEIRLMGPEVRNTEGKRYPVWIDCNYFAVNGEVVFADTKTVCFDKRYKYQREVANGEIVRFDVEWSECRSANILTEYQQMQNNLAEMKAKKKLTDARLKEEKAKKEKAEQMLKEEKAKKEKAGQMLKEEKAKREKAEQMLRKIKNGWSFRLGRFITYLPRKISQLLK